MDWPLTTLSLLCAALGVISHKFYFIHGEHTLSAPLYVLTAIIGPVIITVGLVYTSRLAVPRAIGVTALGCAAYVGALFTSILVYRSLFHPLRRFPGPKLARFTQFYHLFQVKNRVDNFRHLDRLHAEYGDYVRAGPNLLSVADPGIVDLMFSSETKFQKADWYDIGHPITNLAQIRDMGLHDMRRDHGWGKAFKTHNLRNYDARLVRYADQLVHQMHQRSGETIDVARWFEWFSFDVMGDLAFGRAFRTVEEGQSHPYIDTMHETSQFPLGCLGTMPWVIQVIGAMIPNTLNPFMRLVSYSTECVEERRSRRPETPDIMAPILEAGPFFGNAKQDHLLLVGDARLLIIAGSDTVAAAMTFAFYNLARDASLVRRLRAELEEDDIRSDESFAVQRLQRLGFLNAFIDETLRLHPPVPGGTFRNTPQGGVVIADQLLPEGVRVIAPQYTIQRSPRAFVDPDEFIPERWMSGPERVANRNAWFPFSKGRFSCVHKAAASFFPYLASPAVLGIVG